MALFLEFKVFLCSTGLNDGEQSNCHHCIECIAVHKLLHAAIYATTLGEGHHFLQFKSYRKDELITITRTLQNIQVIQLHLNPSCSLHHFKDLLKLITIQCFAVCVETTLSQSMLFEFLKYTIVVKCTCISYSHALNNVLLKCFFLKIILLYLHKMLTQTILPNYCFTFN